MTIFRYTSDTEAFQWDGSDAVYVQITKRLPKGWQSVSTMGVLIVFKWPADTSPGSYNAPVALLCPSGWFLAIDEWNVQLLRPENFSHPSYQRVSET